MPLHQSGRRGPKIFRLCVDYLVSLHKQVCGSWVYRAFKKLLVDHKYPEYRYHYIFIVFDRFLWVLWYLQIKETFVEYVVLSHC